MTPYYSRFPEEFRISDREILSIIESHKPKSVLDIGCASGLILGFLKHLLPDARLVGGDWSPERLRGCREDRTLAGIEFVDMDPFNIPRAAFEAIIANAVLYELSNDQFRNAMKSMKDGLTDDGVLVVFDFFHRAAAVEAEGITIRSMDETTRLLLEIGLSSIEFRETGPTISDSQPWRTMVAKS